jgi:phosphatidylethanolamine/phosphatidyl-N-methylethanolamine N-methyltransferase
MGAVIPSSQALGRAIAQAVVWRPGQVVVELGAGTGAISQALLDSGMPPEALMMVELDRPLFEYLRERFPGVRVVNGDATRLTDILRQQGVEEVGTVISGIPMVNMTIDFQRAIVEQSFAVLDQQGALLQYSYSPISPIPAKKLGIEAKLVRFVLRNLPPATVWRYRPLNRANGKAVDQR